MKTYKDGKYTVKEFANGNKEWYLNGKCHREDGPACEYANGNKAWYLNDKCHTEEQYHKELKNRSANCNGKIVEIDGKKYELKEVNS